MLATKTSARLAMPLAKSHTLIIATRYRSAPFRSSDANVDTNEIISPNDPWLPSLYTDPVRVYSRSRWPFSRTLPEHMRLSYSPLYESPGGKYASVLRRITLGFAVVGVYAAKLLAELAQFDDTYAAVALTTCSIPWVVVQVKTRNYVLRMWRLYDTRKEPQTIELLTTNECLVAEKLSVGGGRTYNELIKVDDLLKVAPQTNKVRLFLGPYATWTQNGTDFYITDNVGGLKMDRLWGIAEKNSGIDNGRFIE